MEMPDKLQNLIGAIPFIALNMKNGEPQFNVNWGHLLQTIITASILGAMGGYILIQRMDVELKYIKEGQTRMESQLKCIETRVYEHMIESKGDKNAR